MAALAAQTIALRSWWTRLWIDQANFRETIVMGKRPDHVRAPDYLSESPPLPASIASPPVVQSPTLSKDKVASDDPSRGASVDENHKKPDPTRYGDWEIKGVAVDF